MRKNILFIGVLVGMMVVMATLTAYSQDDIEFVDDSGFESTMRPLPTFRHDEHNEMADIWECNVCHHVYDDEGNLLEDESSEDMECSECHGAQGDEYPMELVRRYHMNCKGCHLDQKAGPITCGECHAQGS